MFAAISSRGVDLFWLVRAIADGCFVNCWFLFV